MRLPDNMLNDINDLMTGGGCPTAGCLGECAAILETGPGCYQAMLYIWDGAFNDSTQVASWFHNLGAESVSISLTHYSDANDDRDGKTADGVREWAVEFTVKREAPHPKAAPTAALKLNKTRCQWAKVDPKWCAEHNSSAANFYLIRDAQQDIKVLHKAFGILTASAQQPTGGLNLASIAEQRAEKSGWWDSCSGCYETEGGQPVGTYTYSSALACSLGSGCSECGGLGAVWHRAEEWLPTEEEEKELDRGEEGYCATPAMLGLQRGLSDATSTGLPEGRSASAQEVQP